MQTEYTIEPFQFEILDDETLRECKSMKKPLENPEDFYFHDDCDAKTFKLPYVFCESCCYLMNENSYKYHILTQNHRKKFKDKVGQEEKDIYN